MSDGVERMQKTRKFRRMLSVVLSVLMLGSLTPVDNLVFATGYSLTNTAQPEPTPTSATKTETKIVIKKEKIKFSVQKKKNKKLAAGKKKVIQKGVNGLKEKKYENTYVDGVLTKSVLKSTTIVKKPKKKIIEIGTKPKKVSRGGGYRYVKVYTMEATAYTASPGSLTASGKPVGVGRIAVDPKVIPLGTRLYIEGLNGYKNYGYAVAADTGGAIKGYIVDLFFKTSSECTQFGRRKVKVYVLR